MRDHRRSRDFYDALLPTLGYRRLMEHGDAAGDGDREPFVLDPDGHNIEAACHTPVER